MLLLLLQESTFNPKLGNLQLTTLTFTLERARAGAPRPSLAKPRPAESSRAGPARRLSAALLLPAKQQREEWGEGKEAAGGCNPSTRRLGVCLCVQLDVAVAAAEEALRGVRGAERRGGDGCGCCCF